MKLNKLQYAWIKKLKSGTTRKAVGLLRKSNTFCCLGVGVKVCDPNKPVPDDRGTMPLEHMYKLHLNGVIASFDRAKVSAKWLAKIGDHASLVGLNDDTEMSHVDIGKFIDENREAVFTNGHNQSSPVF